LFGDSIASGEGADWRHQRRLAGPAFARGALERMGVPGAQAAPHCVDARADHENLDVMAEMRRLSLAVAGSLLFSADLEPRAETIFFALNKGFTYLHERMDASWLNPDWPWSQTKRRFLEAKRALAEVIDDLIKAR